MRGGLGDLMKQAQQLQESMKQAQQELAKLEVTGKAGGGMVTVVMTGRHEVRRVTIDPKLVLDDPEMLEDMVAAAFNDAVNCVEAAMRERFSGLAGGMGLPGGFKLPF